MELPILNPAVTAPLYEVEIPPAVKRTADSPVYIYVLVDPRNCAVRYVGKTFDPVARFRMHMTEGRVWPANDSRIGWLKALIAEGLKPRMFVVEVVRYKASKEAEWKWVRHYHRAGADLVNGHGIKSAMAAEDE